jgi:RimJ/RimL family protein N-acetyltransferase
MQGGIVRRIERYTTGRLTARRVCWADFEDARRLHSDPQVARTLSADGRPLTEETTRRMLRRSILHWKVQGFGLWMFRHRDTGDLIGRGGLIRYDPRDMGGREEIGLAYAVLSSHWGQGYATEMGDASLCIGFQQLGFESIGAWTLPWNLASQRVMAKLGFRYERDIVFCGLPHKFFRLDRQDYHPLHACVEEAKHSMRR